MLAERKEVYEKHKGNKEELKKQKFPTPAKYKVEFEWLKEVDSLALANAQLNLQTAYKNFFSGQNDFPTFKSKKDKKILYNECGQRKYYVAEWSYQITEIEACKD
jgi:putative transposase